VARLLDASAGAVEIDGRDVRDVTLASLARHVGLVAQDVSLWQVSSSKVELLGVPRQEGALKGSGAACQTSAGMPVTARQVAKRSALVSR